MQKEILLQFSSFNVAGFFPDSPNLMAVTRVTNSVIRLGDCCTFGNHLKPVATIILPKSPTLLGNFCKGAKIINFSSEIIFGQLL